MPFVLHDGDTPVVPRGILQGTGTRAFLHNFAANPEVAKRYMSSLGNQIRTYGTGWDFAWRKSESDPWIPADAHTFSGWILNHVADAVIGAGTGIAATVSAGATAETGPGAIVAGAAAGGLASGGLEAGRQSIGESLGIENNQDVGQVAAATAGGALAEPIGAAGGAVIRGAGNLLKSTLGGASRFLPELAAKIADVNPLGVGRFATTGGKTFMEGVGLTQGGRIPLIDADEAGGILRDAVRWINRVKFPQLIEADHRVATSGIKFDLTRAMKGIEDRTIGNIGKTAAMQEERIYAPGLKSDLTNLLTRIRAETGFTGDWSETPGSVVVSIRRALQKEAFGEGAYKGAGPSETYSRVVKVAAGRVRAAIETGMQPIDPEFSGLMKVASDKLSILQDFKSKLKIADMGPSGQKAATAFVRGVYGDSNVAYIKALNDLDKHFSHGRLGKMVDRAILAIRQANIGERLGNRGLGELLPRVTSGGHVRSGAALLGVGYLAGGPLGILAGGVAASPKFLIRAAGPVAATGAATERAATALARIHLGGGARIITTGAIDTANVTAMRAAIAAEGGGTKGLARQEQPKRRRILIGQ